jgi:putative radical SAM enzyme (TIGR03279 family)
MLKVVSVARGGKGEALGIQPGDQVSRINGEPIRDHLDYHFAMADEEVVIEVLRDLRRLELSTFVPAGEDLGLEFEAEKIRLCGNDCVFCFIDQNPAGMRDTLYVKDEDYRLSFLHGNFVTLTNMKTWELERIVRQRLSPQYISVHSTNPEIRKRLLKPKVERDILEAMGYLTSHGIVLHTQVVLCPGYNDGDDLLHTMEDLARLQPEVQSLAIVPLGMTSHRRGLPKLEPVSPEVARETFELVRPYQRRFRRRFGKTWVYLADEFYRLLGRTVPAAAHYDDFPQLENGIGMTRHFFQALEGAEDLFGEALRRGERAFTVVTGELFGPILRRALRRTLRRTGELDRIRLRLVPVPNSFYGRGVTVAGLLVGRDILTGLQKARRRYGTLGERIFIPPATVNDDGLFLDGLCPEDIASELGLPVSTRAFDPTKPLNLYEGEGAHEHATSCR